MNDAVKAADGKDKKFLKDLFEDHKDPNAAPGATAEKLNNEGAQSHRTNEDKENNNNPGDARFDIMQGKIEGKEGEEVVDANLPGAK